MKTSILVAFFWTGALVNVASAECDKFADNNYLALRNITFFSYDLVEARRPWNAQRSYEREYNCSKNGENPAKDFESLLEGSTLAGQLYGLFGLSEVSPERYEIVKSRYKKTMS